MNSEVYQYFSCKEMDYILLNWLERMRHDGELDKVISRNNQSPSTFLLMFQQPRQLFFKLDNLGNIAYAAWVEPCMGSVFFSFYTSLSHRRKREGLRFLCDMFRMVFDAGVPIICGFIQQRPTPKEMSNAIQMHKKLGYRYRGYLPHFFDGKTCHVVTLSKEDFEAKDELNKNRRMAYSKKAPQEVLDPVGALSEKGS